MNAKQLIEAATYFNDRPSCECDPESGVTNCMGCDIGMMATHILSTVRPDDDEPVTVERMDKEPGFRRARLSDPLWHRVGIDFAVAVWDEKAFASGQCLSSMRLKSMGHLRRLVAALGEK